MAETIKTGDTLGDSLNNYKNLIAVEAPGYNELCQILRQIKVEMQIISIVAQNGKYVAFINTQRQIKFKK